MAARERTDIRPTHSINEGGGERLHLADGRELVGLSVGEKGTLPVRVTAVGEAGHASVPTLGNNAVPLLARLIPRLGNGMPEPPVATPIVTAMLGVLLGRDEPDLRSAVAEAEALHPSLAGSITALMGSTLAPTMLKASNKRNVMPARATVEVDCRILPGTTPADVEATVRALLGDDIAYELEWPEKMVEASGSPFGGPVPAAVAAFLAADGDPATVLPTMCTGFTDSNYLRAAAGTAAYGFSPFRATPVRCSSAGYHNANERVHVDDLLWCPRACSTSTWRDGSSAERRRPAESGRRLRQPGPDGATRCGLMRSCTASAVLPVGPGHGSGRHAVGRLARSGSRVAVAGRSERRQR